jgi:hypothetical protein
MTDQEPPAQVPRYTLGQLIRELEGCEHAYQANLRTAQRKESESPAEAPWWHLQAAAFKFVPDRERMPHIDRLEALCDAEWGTGLTAQNVRKLRGRLCARLGVGVTKADDMTLNAVVDVLVQQAEGREQREGTPPSSIPAASSAGDFGEFASALTCSHCGAESQHLGAGVYYCRRCRTVNDTQPDDTGKLIMPVATADPEAIPVAIVRVHAPFRLTSTPGDPAQTHSGPTSLEQAEMTPDHEHDLLPDYPHEFSLVGNRDTKKAREDARREALDFQQAGLVALGFPWDYWLPIELARNWRSSVFPNVASREAVKQWQSYLRECVGLATATPRESPCNSHRANARSMSKNMAYDLELLRQYNPQLVVGSAPPSMSEQPAVAVPTTSQSTPQASAGAPAEGFAQGPSRTPVEIFSSYSHKDEKLRNQLEQHLSLLKHQGLITGWHDRKIGAGTEWEGQIDQHLNAAHIILLLVSADFLASRYCYDVEMKRAMERHDAGEARVIPVILRPCDWHKALFGKLQALPKDALPVTKWKNRDEAFTDVARGIRAAVAELATQA